MQNNFYLEPIASRHIYKIQHSLNNIRLSYTHPMDFPFSISHTKRYLKKELQGYQAKQRFAFAMIKNTQFVGVCTLYDVNLSTSSAKLYYWVSAEFWRKGLATKGLKKLIDFAKDELKITHLETGVLKKNLASRRVLEKNDFFIIDTQINRGKYHKKFLGEIFLEMRCHL